MMANALMHVWLDYQRLLRVKNGHDDIDIEDVPRSEWVGIFPFKMYSKISIELGEKPVPFFNRNALVFYQKALTCVTCLLTAIACVLSMTPVTVTVTVAVTVTVTVTVKYVCVGLPGQIAIHVQTTSSRMYP